MGGMMSKSKISEQKKKELIAAASNASLESLQEIIGKIENEDERKELINSAHLFSTILHAAAKRGRTDLIEWILSEQGGRAFGFDVFLSMPPTIFFTPLYFAVENGHLEACKAIVNGCRVENGEREKMLNAVDDRGYTVLQIAASKDRRDVVRWLLSEEEGGGRALGFHNIFGGSWVTPLHLAPNLETFLAIVNGCRVDNGEREKMLNAIDQFGWTVLRYAALRNHPEIITWLLSEDGGGAAGFDRSNITTLIAKTLCSSLHLAAESGVEGVQALLYHCTEEERMKLFLAVDHRGWTPLFHAGFRNQNACVTELLLYPESSLLANRKDNTGMTVLHRAIIGGINEESRKEWGVFGFRFDPAMVAALLGSPEEGFTSIDPNIGLGGG